MSLLFHISILWADNVVCSFPVLFFTHYTGLWRIVDYKPSHGKFHGGLILAKKPLSHRNSPVVTVCLRPHHFLCFLLLSVSFWVSSPTIYCNTLCVSNTAALSAEDWPVCGRERAVKPQLYCTFYQCRVSLSGSKSPRPRRRWIFCWLNFSSQSMKRLILLQEECLCAFREINQEWDTHDLMVLAHSVKM